MSKFIKNPTNSKNQGAPVVVPPPNKQARITRDESVAKTHPTSGSSESMNLSHPQKKASPPLPQSKNPKVTEKGAEDAKEKTILEDGEGASQATSTTSTRAPRDPHGHKLVKVSDVFEASHKTKYLPLGDGQYTFAMYLQPFAMKECGKNWCEMEMLELVNGTQTITSKRIYSVDAEDLLKMCYLHAMANLDVQAEPRLHYEQWVLSVFQEYCASYGGADYTDRGSIARCYLESIMYNFSVGEGKDRHGGEPSRLEMFFQKRCVRDLGSIDDRVTTTPPVVNLNVVQGKSLKAKFEYQIEGFIMCVPEGVGAKQAREEREIREKRELEEGEIPLL